MLNRIEAEGQGGAAEERRLGFMAGTRRRGRPLPRVRVFLSRLCIFFSLISFSIYLRYAKTVVAPTILQMGLAHLERPMISPFRISPA